jgi:hypothetical protein
MVPSISWGCNDDDAWGNEPTATNGKANTPPWSSPKAFSMLEQVHGLPKQLSREWLGKPRGGEIVTKVNGKDEKDQMAMFQHYRQGGLTIG